MARDRYDLLLWILLGLSLLGLGGLFGLHSAEESNAAIGQVAPDRALERQLALQARQALITDLYGPVEELMADGRQQQALLKLEEVGRRYPGDAHGEMLRGEILWEMGALREAIAGFVAGIKAEGGYVDEYSPFSRRDLLSHVVDEGLRRIEDRRRAGGSGPVLEEARSGLFYLKSRLAGGCE